MDNLVFQLNSLTFPALIRGFFGPIVKFLYSMIEKSVDLMYELVKLDFGLGDFIEEFTSNVFNILIIYMFFRLTISMLNYLINPESFLDKNTGITKLVSHIIISIVLLISINTMFDLLKLVETKIINSDILTNLILKDTDAFKIEGSTDTSNYIYATKMSDVCPDEYKVYSMSKGAKFSVLALRPFYQPTPIEDVDDKEEYKATFNSRLDNNPVKETSDDDSLELSNYYCGTTIENFTDLPSSAADLLSFRVYLDQVGNWDPTHEEDFVIDFSYLWALIVGVVIFLLVVSFCFDVVVRALTLFFYQLIAPIPIISYMSPNKKDSEMLVNWGKKVMSVWFSLFMRIMILDFILCFINVACNKIDTEGLGFIAQLFVIVGALMFAKKIPKLIEELFPGLKFNGMELNPFKKIKNEALGGEYINGAMGAAAGAAAVGLAGGASNAVAFARNKNNLKKQLEEAKAKGDTEKENKLQKRLDRMKGVRGAGRVAATATGGVAGGTLKGLRSGFTSGKSSTPLSAFKNVSGDIKKNYIARNNRTAIRDFNQDIDEIQIPNIKEATAKQIEDLKVKKSNGEISASEYDTQVADLKTDESKKIEEARQQKYTWVDRNIVENVDKFAGVKNEYGGYGYYNKKIEDLTKKIDNQHQSEMAMRQALATKLAGQEIGYDVLEELRSKMAKANIDFRANISDSQANNYDAKTRNAIEKIASELGDAKKILQSYSDNQSSLAGITNLDNLQQYEKAEKKTYEEAIATKQQIKDKK